VVRAITLKKGANEAENAKLFAMINVAMADAGIQAWDEKYRYNVWRPVVGVREADAGWGPTGLGDGNAATAGDPYWIPLGAPPTNQPSKTPASPNFPAYPSGHATFGTAAIRTAAISLGLPNTFDFLFVSDELDGNAIGATGVRARHVRKLTIASAIEENVLSRVYLGVHWEFDGREGEKNGQLIATKIAGAFPALA
jgi:PAP2 superfamily